jgi:hypothetical protein
MANRALHALGVHRLKLSPNPRAAVEQDFTTTLLTARKGALKVVQTGLATGRGRASRARSELEQRELRLLARTTAQGPRERAEHPPGPREPLPAVDFGGPAPTYDVSLCSSSLAIPRHPA